MFKKSYLAIKNPRVIAMLSILVALHVVISSIFFQVTPELRIYFTFFINAFAAIIGGPIAGLLFGFVADTIGFIVHPSGAYFFGYTLTSMIGMFIYGIFLYDCKLSIVRIVLAKASVNILCNIFLNSLWSYMLFSKGYLFYLGKSAIKNLTLLPIEIILLVIFIRLLLPTLNRLKYTKQKDIPII